MWTVIIIVILCGVGASVFNWWRMTRNFNSERNVIKPDKVTEQWQSLIEQAAGKGQELILRIGQRIAEDKIPEVAVSKRMIRLEGSPEQPFLAVFNGKFKGYELLLGAFDYGSRLNVMWYLVYDTPLAMVTRDTKRAEELTGKPSTWGLQNAKNKSEREGFAKPYNELSMFEKSELMNYISLVHQIITGEVKVMMDGLHLDFSKVNTATKGFFNLS